MILTKPVAIACLLALFVFAAIAGGAANPLEPKLMLAIAEYRAVHPALTHMMVGVTNLGAAYATLGLTAIASLWLAFHRLPARALLLISTVLLERSIVEGLKDLIGRPRPHFDVHLLPASLAYPSGHSANSLTAFLAVAIIVAPPAHRAPWAVGALLLAFFVGLSRIYLGVHWPSDVIGGWSLGLISVGTALMVGQRLGALEPQHQIVGGHGPALGEDEAA